jgi:hypothetical protein
MSAEPSTVDALALLPLPERLHLLTAEQLRGAYCVWCCERLDAETASGLGEQTGTIQGVADSHWFPRACPDCVRQKARKALAAHAGQCEQCVDDPGQCGERQALWAVSVGATR